MDIDPTPITAWFALFIAVATTVSLVVGVIIKINRNFEARVTELIKDTTKQIQPAANGGMSLSDLHRKVDRIEARYGKVIEDQHEQREIWHLRYLKDQERAKSEWVAVFIAIKRMMHMPPEVHPAMWDDITEAYTNGTIAKQYGTDKKENDHG